MAKHALGYILGAPFKKVIWSPCLPGTKEFEGMFVKHNNIE
jgi:hypothetical protein